MIRCRRPPRHFRNVTVCSDLALPTGFQFAALFGELETEQRGSASERPLENADHQETQLRKTV
jgi:hypothetical protein